MRPSKKNPSLVGRLLPLPAIVKEQRSLKTSHSEGATRLWESLIVSSTRSSRSLRSLRIV